MSIRGVADAVGVTPPSIYRHFDDKTALMFEVCSRHFDRLQRYSETAIADVEDEIVAVQEMARAYVRFGLENPEAYRIMFMGRADLTPEQYADEVLAQDSCFASLVRTVQRAVDAGRIRTDTPAGDDAFRVSLTMWAGVHGLTSLLVAKPNMPWPPVEALVEDLLEILLHGASA